MCESICRDSGITLEFIFHVTVSHLSFSEVDVRGVVFSAVYHDSFVLVSALMSVG